MQIKNYWVGDRPAGAWVFQVLNQRTGTPENLSQYNLAKVIMVNSDNDEIIMPVANVSITDPIAGLVTFLWPTESLFDEPGRYVMQVELSSGTAVRRTTTQEILVRELGGVTK